MLDKHRHYNKLIMTLFDERSEVFKELKSLEFDFALIDGMPALAVLA